MSAGLFVAKFYTRASRVRIVIAKFDGRWKLPGGPYPIPELVALVGGILVTLFLLPRLGHPLSTGAVGLAVTAAIVGVMRKMPYSPVKFATRVHRISRLYTEPVSVSGGFDELRLALAKSTVDPGIDILDAPEPPRHSAPHMHQTHPGRAGAPQQTAGWDELFDREPSTAASLFH